MGAVTNPERRDEHRGGPVDVGGRPADLPAVYNSEDQPLFKFPRSQWISPIEGHLSWIEMLELALEDPKEPHVSSWAPDLIRGGPERIQQAIDGNRKEMARLQAELDKFDAAGAVEREVGEG